ncbi:hypothetical protein [Trichloromonas sp.]|uniref:hypothetical protein n=1 Tax=Trichloromonas sp. TaxID=3069249 RepID=UPI002A3D90AC|nr:hypothetical protein [Trichloromonas sp.]
MIDDGLFVFKDFRICSSCFVQGGTAGLLPFVFSRCLVEAGFSSWESGFVISDCDVAGSVAPVACDVANIAGNNLDEFKKLILLTLLFGMVVVI